MSGTGEMITPEISDRICKHMNDDHADAVLLYAKVFGNYPQAIAATMAAIDSQGMDLDTQTPHQTQRVRIPFDHELSGAEDAHHTLIDLLKQARSQPAS